MSHTHELQGLQAYSRALRPGLRLEPLESAGHEVSDEETSAIIRQILTENLPPRSGRKALPDIAPQEELSDLRRAPTPRQQRAGAGADHAPAPVTETQAPDRPPRRPFPVRKVAWFAGLAVLVYMWPWALPLGLFVLVWVAVIVNATVGSARIGRGMRRAYRWLDRRNPERAERLRARADRAALRLDRLLDRLPERWTAGLYLPDFSREALMPETCPDRPDPFDRIAAETRKA